jgi:hypothetical protein
MEIGLCLNLCLWAESFGILYAETCTSVYPCGVLSRINAG